MRHDDFTHDDRTDHQDNRTDHEDFDTFYRRTYPRTLARALMEWRDLGEAEDAVQDAYVALLRHWDKVRGYNSPEAWVYLVMKRRQHRAFKLWSRRRELEIAPPPAARVEDTAEVRAVLDAMPRLPARQREVMVLYCLEGMGQKEIGEALGISRGTVAASLHQARRRLASALDLDSGLAPAGEGGGDALLPAPVPAVAPRSAVGGPRELPAQNDPVADAVRHAEAWLIAACAAHTDPVRTNSRLAEVYRRAAADNGVKDPEGGSS
ncbi:sigma-70 family RNA polymerase sigma factor [Streptomyces sp. NPDC018584]|uniref:sigma-70 family RNA polymerase sigma factor n=1 Tax=unclassified Streptomyces TaxID=2593676 RepID=UPI00378E8217